MTSYRKPQVPIMRVGKYAGTPVDQLPNSYLRWVICQDFPKDIVECAKRKIEQSAFNNSKMGVSRHAIDMFSLRFLDVWLNYKHEDEMPGLGTFIAQMAEKAWALGLVTSKHRHQSDGLRRDYQGIRWVFVPSPHFPDYKEVVTVMEVDEDKELTSRA